MPTSNEMWTYLVGDEDLMNDYKNTLGSPWIIGKGAWFNTRDEAIAGAKEFSNDPSRGNPATPASNVLLIRCSGIHELLANPPNIPIDMFGGNIEEMEVVAL